MSKLITVEQKTILQLFGAKSDFLIPDYQRPYAWEKEQCETLWNDISEFVFPEGNPDAFKTSSEYFLGPIVTFENEDDRQEVIDGQQRLTTIMLLLRAFYTKYHNSKDGNSQKTAQQIEQCIWKTDEFGNPDVSALKIDSEVATDDDKQEFLKILKTGVADDKNKSNYAVNFRFFEKKVDELLQDYFDAFSKFPIRLLNNCILLPIKAESRDTALQIFSTLNDRGLPLSDSDIFKSELYKSFVAKGKKDYFIDRWKSLEDQCEKIFHPKSGTPMDELFTRYMYYERAKMDIKSSTTEALRKFYEKNSYELLKAPETFDNLNDLAGFWNDVAAQDSDRFSDRVLRRLFVLNYAPNGMWTYLVSVYYMHNKDENGLLDDEKFFGFLHKITGFIWGYAVTNPGVNSLRTPVFAEMINIVNDRPVIFADFKFESEKVMSLLKNYTFSNNRALTKSMLAWWAFNDEGQQLLPIGANYEIEHIYAKNRYIMEKSLKDSKNLEALGNKALLEERINIRASDYKFDGKKKFYLGFADGRGKKRPGTEILELIKIANEKSDFVENNIEQRNNDILNGFIDYLKHNDLLKD